MPNFVLVQGECDILHFLVSSQHAQHGDGHFRKQVGGSHQGGDQVMMTMMMVMEALTNLVLATSKERRMPKIGIRKFFLLPTQNLSRSEFQSNSL